MNLISNHNHGETKAAQRLQAGAGRSAHCSHQDKTYSNVMGVINYVIVAGLPFSLTVFVNQPHLSQFFKEL